MKVEDMEEGKKETKMSCGVCLMERAEMVPLDADGKCPKCGAAYPPPKPKSAS